MNARELKNAMIVGIAASLWMGCGQAGDVTVDDETETFRQALPGASELEMTTGDSSSTRQQALAGETSGIARLTAETVVGTGNLLQGQFKMLEDVSKLPPTQSGPNYRVWQGDHQGLTLRVRAERHDAPRGSRFDYFLAAKPQGAGDDAFTVILDGHVVRIGRVEADNKPGFGLVRFHLDNLGTLKPDGFDGKVRIAFRGVGGVRQVHTRAVQVQTPDDPNFPEAAEWFFTLLPSERGELKWHAVGDAKQDGPPYENVAVHSAWRPDHSGMGEAVVFGGSLEFDYLHMQECWDTTFLKGYELIETPDGRLETGDRVSCFAPLDGISAPPADANMPDEDPAIPAAHPEEQDD